MKDLHKIAETLLQTIRTIPQNEKLSEKAGNWIPLENLEKHIPKIQKETGLYIDNQTLLIAIGILTSSEKIECAKAHGRGVGYFYLIRERKEP